MQMTSEGGFEDVEMTKAIKLMHWSRQDRLDSVHHWRLKQMIGAWPQDKGVLVLLV